MARFDRDLAKLKCRKCGSIATHIVEGTAHDLHRFTGLKYRVCTSCGHEEPQTRRPRRAL